jgi:hypothetical protein
MTVVDPRAALAHPGPPARGPVPAQRTPSVPPLPDARSPLSPRVLTWFGIAALLLLVSTAAATVVMTDSALAHRLPSLDDRYLASVRDNSTLTGHDIDDDALVRTGHEVCATLDRRPTLSTVLTTMTELGRTQRWRGDDVAAVIGSAIGAYCPRHISILSR